MRIIQFRAVIHRLCIVTVNGIGRFADDDDLATHGLQKIKHRLHRSLLVLDGVGQKVQRMPAGNIAQIARLKHRFQRIRFLRKLVALLDAVETDLRCLIQALL